ncbi:hypothetical protein BC567DRAFT_230140 [Phyllosticta citribraziliensis]
MSPDAVLAWWSKQARMSVGTHATIVCIDGVREADADIVEGLRHILRQDVLVRRSEPCAGPPMATPVCCHRKRYVCWPGGRTSWALPGKASVRDFGAAWIRSLPRWVSKESKHSTAAASTELSSAITEALRGPSFVTAATHFFRHPLSLRCTSLTPPPARPRISTLNVLCPQS